MVKELAFLTWSAVDHEFDLRSGQAKDYQLGICCVCAKHSALRGKSKDLLARDQDNMSEWSNMSICRLVVQ